MFYNGTKIQQNTIENAHTYVFKVNIYNGWSCVLKNLLLYRNPWHVMKNILQLYICDPEGEGIYGLIIEGEADFVANFVKKKI